MEDITEKYEALLDWKLNEIGEYISAMRIRTKMQSSPDKQREYWSLEFSKYTWKLTYNAYYGPTVVFEPNNGFCIRNISGDDAYFQEYKIRLKEYLIQTVFKEIREQHSARIDFADKLSESKKQDDEIKAYWAEKTKPNCSVD